MNTNTGNNIKNTRGTPTGAKNKLNTVEVQLMMNLYIKGSTEFECCDAFAISKQMFKKIVSGEKAYHYLRTTKVFEEFILKIKESKANKTYFKEAEDITEYVEEPFTPFYINTNSIITDEKDRLVQLKNLSIKENKAFIKKALYLLSSNSIAAVANYLDTVNINIYRFFHGEDAYTYLKETNDWNIMKQRHEKYINIPNKKLLDPISKIFDTIEDEIAYIVAPEQVVNGRTPRLLNARLYDLTIDTILLYKLEGLKESEISEKMNIPVSKITHNYLKFRKSAKSESDKDLINTIAQLARKNVAENAGKAKTPKVKVESVMDLIEEDKLKDPIAPSEFLMDPHDMYHDYKVELQNPIKGAVYLYNGKHLVQQVVQSHEIELAPESITLITNPNMLHWIKAKGRTHYLKWQIVGEFSIRYHMVWDDRRNMVNKYIVKNHAESEWTEITEKAADIILRASNINKENFIEVMGMVENKKYVKYINQGPGTPWEKRDEDKTDAEHDERLAGRNWGVLEGVFFRRMKDWRFEIEHQGQSIEVRVYKNSVYSHSFKNDYENIVKYIQENSSIKNDQLFIPSEEDIYKAFDDFRSVGRG